MRETAESQIQSQLLDLFLFLGSEWILHLLLILSIISVAITLERIYHFWLVWWLQPSTLLPPPPLE